MIIYCTKDNIWKNSENVPYASGRRCKNVPEHPCMMHTHTYNITRICIIILDIIIICSVYDKYECARRGCLYSTRYYYICHINTATTTRFDGTDNVPIL